MSTYETRFKEAVERLQKDLDPPARELSIFEAEAKEATDQGRPYPPSYFKAQRDKIIGRIAYGEMTARAAFAVIRDEALAEAREVRAASKVGRDPQARMADELERASLIGSASKTAEALAIEARAMLEAKQPRRAEFLLSVAIDKGWTGETRIDSATGPYNTRDALTRMVEDALDSDEPDRQAARSLEESVAASTLAFEQERRVALTKFGIGVTRDGSIGTGRFDGPDGLSEVAVASIGAKMRAHASGKPTPDGLLASSVTGAPARSKGDS